MISEVSTFISDIIVQFGYLGLIFVTFLENVIAPIPSEFVFPWAGFLAAEGRMNIFLISLSGAIGSVMAAYLLYFLGSKFSGDKTRAFVDKYGKFLFVSLKDLEKAEGWFEKYGVWTVLIFRMIPLGRSVISIPAGFVKMKLSIFLTLTFIGTFAWSLLLTYAGYILGENWIKVSEILKEYEHFVIYAVIALGFLFLYFKRDQIPLVNKLKK